ncbi:alpha-glucoside transport system permease protein [Cryobacterium mesophilum]|uniref:Sugar ABC transporter permease n=1 Tax=Terrimesophilobacter mesophilus TaxID=433647 RepID=A0A4R8VCI1_9MICO|nr:sugar ABC transporter permease [Terrimesophilobacter mesophilus]MBB5633450.1 alpha-glucoside transport system permease protein [Terrimesophilobacter mesophilus]TFB80166.1 sugar ABC transporter permease [Terrimesophilobacter mesophilus]
MSQFLGWIATLPAWLQIILVIAAFLAVIGLLLFFIEIAPRTGRRYTAVRLAVCVLVPLIAMLILGSVIWAALIAAVLGGLFFLLDYRSRQGAGYLFQLVGFLAPAVILLAIGLIYPTIGTTIQAFQDNRSRNFVGLDNFIWIFTQPYGIRVVVNTIVWVLIVPTLSTIFGLAYAAFIDKSRGEKIFKALVFMPMAISFVGASIIWKFVYDAKPVGQEQIGLLNQIVVWFGGEPVYWLQNSPWNTFFLIVVLIWIQTGFAMVILSAAIKGVPAEQLEAAELDGTNAWQRFMNVTVPGIRSSLIVVLTTISIASLKVFDIVRTMTAGTNETSVIANEMYTQWKGFETGRSAAFAVVLFLLVMPIIIYNARQIKKQREIR